MPRCARGVGAVAGVADPGVVRVRRIDRDAADESARGRRGVDLGEADTRRCGIDVLGHVHVTEPGPEPHGLRIAGGPGKRDEVVGTRRQLWPDGHPVTTGVVPWSRPRELVALGLELRRVPAAVLGAPQGLRAHEVRASSGGIGDQRHVERGAFPGIVDRTGDVVPALRIVAVKVHVASGPVVGMHPGTGTRTDTRLAAIAADGFKPRRRAVRPVPGPRSVVLGAADDVSQGLCGVDRQRLELKGVQADI